MSAPNGIWLNKIYLREESREVDDLAAALDALDEAETDNDPGGNQFVFDSGIYQTLLMFKRMFSVFYICNIKKIRYKDTNTCQI